MNIVRVIAWLRDEPWGSAGGSQATWPNWRRIPCHARRYFVKATYLTESVVARFAEDQVKVCSRHWTEVIEGMLLSPAIPTNC